jgi:hypothetical protein
MYDSSSDQIDLLGSTLLTTNWRGVFPLDKLPNVIGNGGYIVNTQTATLAGEHWLAVDVRNHQTYLFDPLGFYYPPLLVSQLTKRTRHIVCNTIMYQHPLTTTCGQHCLLWLSKRYM